MLLFWPKLITIWRIGPCILIYAFLIYHNSLHSWSNKAAQTNWPLSVPRGNAYPRGTELLVYQNRPPPLDISAYMSPRQKKWNNETGTCQHNPHSICSSRLARNPLLYIPSHSWAHWLLASKIPHLVVIGLPLRNDYARSCKICFYSSRQRNASAWSQAHKTNSVHPCYWSENLQIKTIIL